jgi:hypothetical protein
MPIVPVVDQNTPGNPAVQAPTVAPMRNYAPQQIEQLGQATEQAGLASMRTNQAIGERIQEQMDDANVKAAESKFIQSATDILHGDKGYMNQRGADAINGFDPSSQALIKAKKDVLDSLGNEVQKYIFNQWSQQHLATFGAQMSQHRAQQRVEYTSAQALARADSMRSMAQNSEIGSKDQNVSIETGVSEIKNALSLKGIPADSEEAKKYERAFRSQITQDNVSRLMEDGKYEDASKLLSEQMKAGNVEGDTGDRLRRAIRSNLQRTENIEATDKIFQPYVGKELKATDLEAMLAKVNEITNPEQRVQVDSMVKSKFSEQHSIQQQKYRDNLNDVVNFKYGNNGSLKGVDPVKWGALDAKDQYELSKPEAVETDLNTWYGFITKPDTLTLPNVNNAYARGLLSKGDFKGFTERAMEVSKKNDYVQEANDINGRIDYFANQAGLKIYGTQTPEDKVKHGALTYAVQNEIDRVKKQNHGKITSEQVDQIVKRELTQQTLQQLRSPFNPAAWFGNRFSTSQKYTFEMPEGAVGTGQGADGKMHYVDAQGNDLGEVK